jgi:hypothetical protein
MVCRILPRKKGSIAHSSDVPKRRVCRAIRRTRRNLYLMNIDPVTVSMISLTVSLVSLGVAITALFWDKKKWKQIQAIQLRCTAVSYLNIGKNFNHFSMNMAQVDQLNYFSIHVNNVCSRNVTLMTIALHFFKNESAFRRQDKELTVSLELPDEHKSKLPCELGPGQNWQGAFLHSNDLKQRAEGKVVKIAVFESVSGSVPHYVDIMDGKIITAEVLAKGTLAKIGILPS